MPDNSGGSGCVVRNVSTTPDPEGISLMMRSSIVSASKPLFTLEIDAESSIRHRQKWRETSKTWSANILGKK